MKITQKTQTWGNSTGIRIPKKVLSAARWLPNQEVRIDVEGDTVILKPVAQARPDTIKLEELVGGITSENRHTETDWAEPVGNEAW